MVLGALGCMNNVKKNNNNNSCQDLIPNPCRIRLHEFTPFNCGIYFQGYVENKPVYSLKISIF